MTATHGKTLTVLAALVAVLLIAVVGQSVAIYSFHQKLGVLTDRQASSIARGNGDASQGQMDPLNATPANPLAPDPFDADPFGWGQGGWDPFKEMHSMHDRIDQMFGDAFNRFQQSDDFGGIFGDYSFSPDIDVEDKGDHYLVTVDVPGAEDSRLDVKTDGELLTITGTVSSEHREEDKGKMLRQERRSGSFRRTITLPGPVKADAVKTHQEKGVLYIELPKDVT